MGDAAWRFDLPAGADRASVLAALRALPRVTDAVVTDRHALVRFEPGRPPDEAGDAIADARSLVASERRLHVIRARYDGEDLDAVARLTGKTREQVVALHSDRDYRVEMIGFLPGFAYLGPLDTVLAAVPRRPAPRARVSAGAIGIAAGRTGVYPFVSPGGWHLLGTAVGFSPFDAERGAALSLGDVVRFEQASEPGRDPVSRDASVATRVSHPALAVEQIAVGSTIQDLGRRGRLHEGVPPGGALVPEALAASNRAVGNEGGAAAVEIALGPARLRALEAVRVALDGRAVSLRAGEVLEVGATGLAVHYVALEGGIDVPVVLGGKGTLLVARLGGLEGRMLRAGDVLGSAGSRDATRALSSEGDVAMLSSSEPVRVILGPDDFPESARAALLGSNFRVSPSSDRVGTRLEGAKIPWTGADRAGSTPMVRGAIQVTLDGTPIVLGPDHPTTGGYPVIAVVVSSDLGRFAARRPGEVVRFRS